MKRSTYRAGPARRWRLRRLMADKAGSVAIVAAVGMTSLIGFVGLGVDVGVWYKIKRDLQNAADAAAVAAATNGTSTYQSEAKAVAAKYGLVDGVNRITVSAASGQTCPDTSNTCYRVTITESPAPVYFAAALGFPGAAVSSTALAQQSGPLCILALNATDSGAIDMSGNAAIRGPACQMQGNSASTSGMTQEGKPEATLKKITVSGGYTGQGYSVTPLTNQPSVPDPYAAILQNAFPASTCSSYKGLDIKSDTTLSPGTYCGGIHINSSAKVALQPGVYIMNGGPLWVNGGATVTGTQVMIGFTGDGSTLYVEGNASLNLTSPTSGPYQNIQFFEDPAQVVDRRKGCGSVSAAAATTTAPIPQSLPPTA